MKYDVVQTAIEAYVKANWTATSGVQYDNTAFNSENFNEFLRCNVVFGEGLSRTITKGCYRQIGLLILSIFTRPAEGAARKLQLATLAADMMKHKVLTAVSTPAINFKVPDLFNDNKERDGWVMAQVSIPFYYDFTE